MMGKRKPALRFKGFEGEWETCRLGDIADLLTGYPFESKHFTHEGIPLIRGMNVKRGYLDMSEDICEYWSSITGLETYLLRENDIVIQMDGALIGKSYALVSKENVPSLLVQRVTRVRCPKHHFQYVYQIIQRDFLKYIKGNKTETAVPHLSLNDIKKFELALISVEEQTQIGTFFKHLDTLIIQQQRKYDSLLNVKKSMLEKMFPKDGADVPEIRFKGFSGVWSRYELGELAVEVIRKAPEHSTASVMMISASSGFINQSEKYSSNNAGSSLKNYTLLQKGELSYNHGYSKFRNYGSCFELKEDEARIPFVYHSFALPNDNSTFYSQYLNSGIFDGELRKRVSSTARMDGLLNISYDAYMSINVCRPSLEEQTKIGNYFKHLDTHISLHRQKLDHLNHIKSALLEKMFVSEAA